MLVGNFTPDDIDWTHVGQVGTLKAGATGDFPDPRANHILTKYGPRGLLRVEWDKRDDIPFYKEKAMAVYINFWKMQIGTFNQQNEQRKNENKVYTSPTRILSQKAAELDVELMEPWKAVKKTDSGEMNKLKRENEDLREEVSALSASVREMVVLVKQGQKMTKEAIIIDTASFLRQFNNLGKDRFQNWVIDNMDLIPEFPASVYATAKSKWDDFYKDDAWPVSDCIGANDLKKG